MTLIPKHARMYKEVSWALLTPWVSVWLSRVATASFVSLRPTNVASGLPPPGDFMCRVSRRESRIPVCVSKYEPHVLHAKSHVLHGFRHDHVFRREVM
mgnify:CR=1 FL=1